VFPVIKTGPRKISETITDTLKETLFDDARSGPTMFIQAPSVQIYTGEHTLGDMDELLWFGEVATLARNTRQTLQESGGFL
jgi:hypothetical protein